MEQAFSPALPLNPTFATATSGQVSVTMSGQASGHPDPESACLARPGAVQIGSKSAARLQARSQLATSRLGFPQNTTRDFFSLERLLDSSFSKSGPILRQMLVFGLVKNERADREDVHSGAEKAIDLAWAGVYTMGSFSLKEVLRSTGTPVRSPNRRMSFQYSGFTCRSTVWSRPGTVAMCYRLECAGAARP